MRGAVNFGSGFLQGFNTAQHSDLAYKQNARADEALAEGKRRAAVSEGLAQERLDLTRQQFDANQGYRDQTLDLQRERLAAVKSNAEADQRYRQQQHQRAVQADELALLQQNGIAHLMMAGESGQFDEGMEAKLAGKGLHYLTAGFYANDENLNAGMQLQDALNAVQENDLGRVNSPENMAAFNTIYGPLIQRGIGEVSQSNGQKIVSKEWAGLRLAPNSVTPDGTQGVVAQVKVGYADGTSEIKPISLHRSSNPDDPVHVIDAGQFIDDVQGRVLLTKEVFNNPDVRQRLKMAAGKFGGTTTERSRGAKVEYLQYLQDQLGMSADEALAHEKLSSSNPEKAIEGLAKIIVENPPLGKEPPSLEQAYAEARQVYYQYHNTPEPGGARPQFDSMAEALEAAKARYPGKSDQELVGAIRRQYPNLQ